MRLTASEQKKSLQFLQTLFEYSDLETFQKNVVKAAARLFPADLTVFNDHDLQTHQVHYRLYPHAFPALPEAPDILRWGLAHNDIPMYPFWKKIGEGRAVRFSDLVPKSQQSRWAFFHEFYLPHHIPYGIVMMVSVLGSWHLSLSFHRTDTDFSPHQRDLINLLRPHLSQALHNALAVTAWQFAQNQIPTTVPDPALPLALVTTQGRLLWATDQSLALFQQYGESLSPPKDLLPAIITEWVQCQEQRANDPEHRLRPPQNLALHRNGKTLYVRLMPMGTTRLLVFEESPSPTYWHTLEPYGVTPKEREVVTLLLAGKTNREMSHTLGIQVGTIQKHLGHLFEKFGVENRTALIATVKTLVAHPPNQ
ncbi:MAG: helix-turn-helix transcriptional regulator [Nitrospira sp.]|nr:helix-turn-helix transcriptional regulator [Nitrospira sp.]